MSAPRKPANLLRIVRAGYRVHVRDVDWLERIADEGRPALDHGLGVVAAIVDGGHASTPRVLEIVGAGAPPEALELGRTLHHSFDPQQVTVMGSGFGVRVATGILGGAQIERLLHPLGIGDLVAIGGADTDGHGFYLSVLVPLRSRATGVRAEALTKVAVHLLCAYRLRRAMSRLRAEVADRGSVEATLDRRARIVDAHTPLSESAREALRTGVAAWAERYSPKLWIA